MSGKINSIRKGKFGERELAKLLSKLLGVECRRGQQYDGLEGRDVVGLPGIHVECKRTEKLQLSKAMRQAVEDAEDGDIPSVWHRRSREPWLVTVRVDDLVQFVEKIKKGGNEK